MQYPTYDFNDYDQSWAVFSDLLAGLGEKTPLGRIVAIRSEDDEDMLKSFTPDMLEERQRWRSTHQDHEMLMSDDEIEKAQAKLFTALGV